MLSSESSELIRKKAIEECPNFGVCDAPICLLDSEKENCIWFPDDGICKKNFPPDWVKIQKKIKKKTRSLDTYYTYEMLNRNCIVKGGIVGIDPDREREGQIRRWFRNHKPKKVLTEEEKEILRKRFAKKLSVEMKGLEIGVLSF